MIAVLWIVLNPLIILRRAKVIRKSDFRENFREKISAKMPSACTMVARANAVGVAAGRGQRENKHTKVVNSSSGSGGGTTGAERRKSMFRKLFFRNRFFDFCQCERRQASAGGNHRRKATIVESPSSSMNLLMPGIRLRNPGPKRRIRLREQAAVLTPSP